MDFLNIVLPVLLYTFGIILLIVLIILGIRMIQIIEKVDRLIDNLEGKVNSLNSLFAIIDHTADGITMVTDRVISTVTNTFSRIFKKKKREDIIDE